MDVYSDYKKKGPVEDGENAIPGKKSEVCHGIEKDFIGDESNLKELKLLSTHQEKSGYGSNNKESGTLQAPFESCDWERSEYFCEHYNLL